MSGLDIPYSEAALASGSNGEELIFHDQVRDRS